MDLRGDIAGRQKSITVLEVASSHAFEAKHDIEKHPWRTFEGHTRVQSVDQVNGIQENGEVHSQPPRPPWRHGAEKILDQAVEVFNNLGENKASSILRLVTVKERCTGALVRISWSVLSEDLGRVLTRYILFSISSYFAIAKTVSL